jgi:transcriptional regulator with XRE-family HTH domain
MNSTGRLTGRLIAAARVLTGTSQDDLASASGIALETLRLIESSGAAWIPDRESEILRRALEAFGGFEIDDELEPGRLRYGQRVLRS